MNEGLKLDEVVPVLRADLKIGEPTPGRGETTVAVADPATGREVTVRGFEVSIMRMLNGRRTAEEVLSAASQIGLPLTLESLGVFIRRLRKEGFLGEAGTSPQNLLTWEPRNEWSEEIRRLYQEALREARADRLVAAKSRLDTLLARAPGTKEAQQLLHWVMERLRPEGGPKTPLFKDVYGEVEKGWFEEGERQSQLNESATVAAVEGGEASTAPQRPPVGAIAIGGVLLLLLVLVLVPFPRTVKAKVSLLPLAQADVKAPHAGVLKDVPSLGQSVQKGQVLAHFDSAPVDKRLKELEGELAQAEKKAKAPAALPKRAAEAKVKLARAEAAYKAAQSAAEKLAAKAKGKANPALARAQKTAAGAKAAFEAAKAAYDQVAPAPAGESDGEVAKLIAERDRLKAELAAATITAPVAGQVVELKAAAGQPIAADGVLAKVADTSSLTAVIRVGANDAKALKAGTSVSVKLSGVTRQVKLDRVEGERAEATIDNSKGALKPGLEGEAEVPGESKSVFGRM